MTSMKMMVRSAGAALGVLLAFTLTVHGQVGVAAQYGPNVHYEHNVTMKTRDGVTLRADVYWPAAEGKYPTLLQRTPYNKDGAVSFALRAVARGFMVVVQDVRGRYASDGDWYPFKYEQNDGYDTIEWVAGLPGSSGKVGMWGGSYVGATQMLAAIAHPPHLAGICPGVTASNYHDGWAYQGGAFDQWFNESWTSGLAQDTLDRRVHKATRAEEGDKVLPLTEYPVFQGKFDMGSADATRELAPYFADWAKHIEYDDYWKQWAIAVEHYADIRVPSLTVAAWYDIFQGGSLKNFQGLRDHAGNDEARREQRLLVTIGGHAGGGRKIGAVDFGPAAAEYDEWGVTLDWYDYLFQGKKNQFATDNRVEIFVMGKNQWRWEKNWPLERAKETNYYLHSAGQANSVQGDGKLSEDETKGEATDTFVYDPADPVPTRDRRAAMLWSRGWKAGAAGPERRGEAQGCAGVFDDAAGQGSRGDGTGEADSVCEVFGGRYGLYREAGGCGAGWLLRAMWRKGFCGRDIASQRWARRSC